MFNFKFPWARAREARKFAEATQGAAAAPAPALGPGLRTVRGLIVPAPHRARSSTGLASGSSNTSTTSSAPPAPSDDSWMYTAALHGSSTSHCAESRTSTGSDWGASTSCSSGSDTSSSSSSDNCSESSH